MYRPEKRNRVKNTELFLKKKAQKLIDQINDGGKKMIQIVLHQMIFWGVSFLKTIKNCVARGGLSSKLRGMVATGCISNVNRKMIIIYRGKPITCVIKDVPRC